MANFPLPIGSRMIPFNGSPDDACILQRDEVTGELIGVDKYGVAHKVDQIKAVQFDGERFRSFDVYSNDDNR